MANLYKRANDCYYQADGAIRGPVTRQELLDKLAAGELAPETPVYREGEPQWHPLNAAEPVIVPEPAGPGKKLTEYYELLCCTLAAVPLLLAAGFLLALMKSVLWTASWGLAALVWWVAVPALLLAFCRESGRSGGLRIPWYAFTLFLPLVNVIGYTGILGTWNRAWKDGSRETPSAVFWQWSFGFWLLVWQAGWLGWQPNWRGALPVFGIPLLLVLALWRWARCHRILALRRWTAEAEDHSGR